MAMDALVDQGDKVMLLSKLSILMYSSTFFLVVGHVGGCWPLRSMHSLCAHDESTRATDSLGWAGTRVKIKLQSKLISSLSDRSTGHPYSAPHVLLPSALRGVTALGHVAGVYTL